MYDHVLILGYGPELFKCAICQQKLNPYNLYFSNKEGGVICKDCSALKRDGVKIESNIVKILRLILKKDWEILLKIKIENELQKSLKEVSDSYYKYLIFTHSKHE